MDVGIEFIFIKNNHQKIRRAFFGIRNTITLENQTQMNYSNISKSIAGFVLFTLIALFSSCESYLEEESRSNIGMGQIKDLKSLDIALNGVYSRLQDCYSTRSMGLGEAGTDITMSSKSNAYILPIDQYTLTSSSKGPAAYWAAHYILVKDANNVIDKTTELLEEGVLVETDAISIKAEAHFLRAFAFMRLMQAFGEIPLIESAVKLIDKPEYYYGRNSIDSVFHFIENDFLYAINSGGLRSTKDGGRANVWAAKFLLAKLYLYVGTSKHRNEVGTPTGGIMYDRFTTRQPEAIPGGTKDLIPGYNDVRESYMELYEKSHTLLDDIIKHGGFDLMPNFYEPFLVSNKNKNVESIWEIQFSSTTGYGSDWSKQFGVRSNSPVNDYLFSSVSGNLVLQPVPSFFKYYKIGDARQDLYVFPKRVLYTGETFTSIETLEYSFDFPLINPSNNAPFKQKISIDLNSENDTILEASYLQSALTLQIGTMKYNWGQSSSPDLWVREVMSYPANNCPNNIIVARFADVLLMFAETEMLLNGASPAQPQQAGFATSDAINAVNRVLERAMSGTDRDMLVADLTTSLIAQKLEQEADVSAKLTTYENNKSNVNWGNYVVSISKLNSINYKIDNIESLVVKKYDQSTFTYEMLIDERARELCFEFHRWFDLQRLGWLKYKVMQRKMNFDSNPIPVIVEPTHYLYPLPFSDTDLSMNPDFKKNNPGYGY